MQIGSLGAVVFEVSWDLVRTPTSVNRERKARYEEHKVIGALPRLEFVAPELATITLPIHLRVDMGVDPMREADNIGAMCKAGTATRLILAGFNFGFYVVESMSQTFQHCGPGGIYAVDLSLNLKEYV